jgi:hypothetical protein
VDFATAFNGSIDWTYINGPAWQLDPWSQWVKARPGRNLSYAIAMFPQNIGGSLASCAAGQYDAHYRTLASNLASRGLLSAYLRPGWEMDGNWYPWSAPAGSGKEASFAGCFRRVVQVMRQAQPANQWKFVFNPTDIAWPNATYLEALWPGEAYVDVVGVDSYDQSWWPNTYPYPSTCDAACRLQRQKTAWSHRVSRLNTLRDFAIKHGRKPMGFPEWGLVNRKESGAGGLDNPYYIQKMYEFITDPANNVVMHAYFDVNAEADWRLSSFPQAGALFRQLFGAGSD